MAGMTADERAEHAVNSDWREYPYPDYQLEQQIVFQIRQAEAAGARAARRKAFAEAAACARWIADVAGSWKKNLTNAELHGLKDYWVGRTDGGKEMLKAIRKLMENPDD